MPLRASFCNAPTAKKIIKEINLNKNQINFNNKNHNNKIKQQTRIFHKKLADSK